VGAGVTGKQYMLHHNLVEDAMSAVRSLSQYHLNLQILLLKELVVYDVHPNNEQAVPKKIEEVKKE